MKQSINFSQFELNKLESEQKELLVLNLQSKVIKNTRFEKMLNNERLSNILTILKGESSCMKTNIIEEIKNLDLVSTFGKINGEELDTFQIIKKYFNEIKGLLNMDMEVSNKYVIIYIQYVLDGDYEIEDIKRIIKRTKEMYEMTQETLFAEMEAELFAMDLNEEDINEQEELEIEQEINNLIHNLNLEKEIDEETEEVLYISKLEKYDEMIELFRNALKIKHNMRMFLERLAAPFLSSNDQIVAVDLIKLLLEKVIKDSEMTKSLKQYILQEIVNFMTYKQ